MPDAVERGCWEDGWSAQSRAVSKAWKTQSRSYQVPFAGRKSLHWEENEEEDETETSKAFGGAGLCKARGDVRTDYLQGGGLLTTTP